MAQFNTEGQPAFPVADTEKENSTDSPTETTTDDTTQPDGGAENPDENNGDGEKKKGFADDPRWKEREEDWKRRYNEQETRHTEELGKLREEILGKISPAQKPTKPEVPAWFGGDENDWKEYQDYQRSTIEEVQKNTLEQVRKTQQDEQKRIDEATTYFNEQIALLESDKTINPKGEKIDRNKLLKFTLDNELVDTKGRWNYKAALLLMRSVGTQVKTTNTNERKKIAGATTENNRAEEKSSNVTTSEDFQKPGARPW